MSFSDAVIAEMEAGIYGLQVFLLSYNHRESHFAFILVFVICIKIIYLQILYELYLMY